VEPYCCESNIRYTYYYFRVLFIWWQKVDISIVLSFIFVPLWKSRRIEQLFCQFVSSSGRSIVEEIPISVTNFVRFIKVSSNLYCRFCRNNWCQMLYWLRQLCQGPAWEWKFSWRCWLLQCRRIHKRLVDTQCQSCMCQSIGEQRSRIFYILLNIYFCVYRVLL